MPAGVERLVGVFVAQSRGDRQGTGRDLRGEAFPSGREYPDSGTGGSLRV